MKCGLPLNIHLPSRASKRYAGALSIPATEFHRFQELPFELRLLIWECIMAETVPRAILISDHSRAKEICSITNAKTNEVIRPYSIQWCNIARASYTHIPAVLHINSESRCLGLKTYDLAFGLLLEFRIAIPFDWNRDTLVIRTSAAVRSILNPTLHPDSDIEGYRQARQDLTANLQRIVIPDEVAAQSSLDGSRVGMSSFTWPKISFFGIFDQTCLEFWPQIPIPVFRLRQPDRRSVSIVARLIGAEQATLKLTVLEPDLWLSSMKIPELSKILGAQAMNEVLETTSSRSLWTRRSVIDECHVYYHRDSRHPLRIPAKTHDLHVVPNVKNSKGQRRRLPAQDNEPRKYILQSVRSLFKPSPFREKY